MVTVIKKILRTIRQKPQAVREQYAFWIACTLTSVVAVGWFMNAMGQFDVSSLPGDSDVTVTAPETFSNFLEDTQEQFSSVEQAAQHSPPEADVDLMSNDMLSASGSVQSVAVVTTPPVVSRQEVRIATTSATSQRPGSE